MPSNPISCDCSFASLFPHTGPVACARSHLGPGYFSFISTVWSDSGLRDAVALVKQLKNLLFSMHGIIFAYIARQCCISFFKLDRSLVILALLRWLNFSVFHLFPQCGLLLLLSLKHHIFLPSPSLLKSKRDAKHLVAVRRPALLMLILLLLLVLVLVLLLLQINRPNSSHKFRWFVILVLVQQSIDCECREKSRKQYVPYTFFIRSLIRSVVRYDCNASASRFMHTSVSLARFPLLTRHLT